MKKIHVKGHDLWELGEKLEELKEVYKDKEVEFVFPSWYYEGANQDDSYIEWNSEDY